MQLLDEFPLKNIFKKLTDAADPESGGAGAGVCPSPRGALALGVAGAVPACTIRKNI